MQTLATSLHPTSAIATIHKAIDINPLLVSSDRPITAVIRMMSGDCWVDDAAQPSPELSPPPVANNSGPSTPQTCVLVTDGAAPIGILTQQDIIRLIASNIALERLTVGDVMTQPLITMAVADFHEPFAPLALFQQHGIHHLPIVNARQHLIGLVTASSLRQMPQAANLLKLQHVKDVVETQILRAAPTVSVLRLAQLMSEYEVNYVALVDETTAGVMPVGLVTAADILQLQAQRANLEQIPAERLILSPYSCVDLADSLWVAYEEMQQQQRGQLLVTNSQGALVGWITDYRLLRAGDPAEIQKVMRHLRQSLRQMEAEKIDLLKNRNAELERQVRVRTLQIEEQSQRILKELRSSRLLAETAMRIQQSLDLKEILNITVSEVRQLLQCDRTLIYRLQPDPQGSVVVESVTNQNLSLLGKELIDPCFSKALQDTYCQGHIQAVENIQRADLSPCYIEFLQQLQVKANLVIPLMQEDKLWGLLIAQHCTQPRRWQSWEINLLTQLSTQVGIAIQKTELYRQLQAELKERQQAEIALQQSNEALEIRVEERTASWRQVNEQLLSEIAERNRVEIELRHAKEKLEAVLNAVPGLVSWVDSDLRYEGVNCHLAAMFNRPAESFIGQDVGFISGNSKLTNFFQRLFQSPDQRVSEEITVYLDEAPQTYLIAAQKYNDNKSIVSIGIDITEHQKAEIALQESEAKFRNLVEQTNDWVWEIDRNLVFTYVNPKVKEITGYEPEEILNHQIFEFLPEDESIRFSTVFNHFFFRPEAFTHIEKKLIHKDGHRVDVESSGSPVFNIQGELQGYRGITRDITERKQVERDIRKALTKEKELGELKSRFISMASHEFRTPLTTIYASAEALEHYRHRWSEEKNTGYLHRIQATVKHMTSLLNDVLIVGRADSGKLDCQPKWMDLEEFCRDLAVELQLGSGDDQRIEFSCTGDLKQVWADEKLLRQILGNLLSNALKYSPIHTQCYFQADRKGKNIVFRVQDEGISIPLADQKQLFDLFHRASNVGNIPGTGLGLAIVKKSVDAHGGKISFVTESGVGTTFTVVLPSLEVGDHHG